MLAKGSMTHIARREAEIEGTQRTKAYGDVKDALLCVRVRRGHRSKTRVHATYDPERRELWWGFSLLPLVKSKGAAELFEELNNKP